MGKPCQSNGCVYPIFSNGYCKFHQGKRQDSKYKNRKSISQVHIDKMKALNNGNGEVVVEEREVQEKTPLELWFDMVAGEIRKSPFCWNCGERIPDKYFR